MNKLNTFTAAAGTIFIIASILCRDSGKCADLINSPAVFLIISAFIFELMPIYFKVFGRFTASWFCWLGAFLISPQHLIYILACSFLSLCMSCCCVKPKERSKKSIWLDCACQFISETFVLWILMQLQDSAENYIGSSKTAESFMQALLPSAAVFIFYPLVSAGMPFLLMPSLKTEADREALMRFQKLFGCRMMLGTAAFILSNTYKSSIFIPAMAFISASGCLSWAQSVNLSEDFLRSRRLTKSLENTALNLSRSRQSCQDLKQELKENFRLQNAASSIEESLKQQQNSLQENFKQALTITAILFKASQAAVFAYENNRQIPFAVYKSSKILDNWTLLGYTEPLAHSAWQRKSILFSKDSGSILTLHQGHFQEYPYQAAAFISESKVLWIARDSEEFTEKEIKAFIGTAAKICRASQESELISCLSAGIEILKDDNSRLYSWNEKLNKFFKGLSRAFDLRNNQAALDEIEELIKSVINTDFVFFVFGKTSSAVQSNSLKDSSEESLYEICRCVCRSAKPLLIDNAEAVNLKMPSQEIKSVLAVPILSAAPSENDNTDMQISSDAVILASSAFNAFSRQDQDIMLLLAERLDSIIKSHTLHKKLQSMHIELKKSQASLIQSGKMAAVGQMAAGLAHELNTPLGAVILGIDSAQLSIKRENTEKASERLAKAKDAAQHAQGIIKSLLYYSRDEAKFDVLPEDLNRITDDALILVNHYVKKHNIKIIKDQKNIPLCRVNRNEMQQVFTNLIINACDAVKENPGERILQISSDKNLDGTVNIHFKDNGSGIKPEDIKRIFEPFFTTKDVGCGTGLGLSVSMEIIKKLGGNISVKSLPGSTVFTVEIPSA